MSLYSHLRPKDAKVIINLANNKFSNYQIAKKTKILKGKISRCLDQARIIEIRENLQKPWKGPHQKITYSFKKVTRWSR